MQSRWMITASRRDKDLWSVHDYNNQWLLYEWWCQMMDAKAKLFQVFYDVIASTSRHASSDKTIFRWTRRTARQNETRSRRSISYRWPKCGSQCKAQLKWEDKSKQGVATPTANKTWAYPKCWKPNPWTGQSVRRCMLQWVHSCPSKGHRHEWPQLVDVVCSPQTKQK